MRIHLASVLRSGTLAALLAGFILLLALTPFFGTLLTILLAAGLLLFPLGAGFYYGYLAPGKETMFQSAVGGALSGLVSGAVLGIAFGLNQFTLSAVTTGLLGRAIISSFTVAVLTAAIFGIFGAILGALGGIFWRLAQGQAQTQ